MKNIFKNKWLWLAVIVLCYSVSISVLYLNQLKMKVVEKENIESLQKIDTDIKSSAEEVINRQSQLNSLKQQKSTLENQVKNLY
ncbi:MAG: hypothetical protein K1X86_00325 [Ignavibacteria bacterium]|nr:hypothetical protein [Ignavibacteria bacterium]